VVIYKYILRGVTTVVSLPASAKILSVGAQGEDIVFWALIDPDEAKSDFVFAVYGTGWEIPDDLDQQQFVGTVQRPDGLVFHVFYTK
jgi:predicted nucleotidyltransferase